MLTQPLTYRHHNTMSAYFSEVDNADEKGTMLYGVVGCLKQGFQRITFELKTRAGVSGRFIPLYPNVIIEEESPELNINSIYPVAYPETWHDRVVVDGRILVEDDVPSLEEWARI